MKTARFEIVSPTTEQKHHDMQLCYEIMDELRSCAQHARDLGKRAEHVGTRVGLNGVALLCEAGLSTLQQCILFVHPEERPHLEEITEEAIETAMNESSDEDWRPGACLPPDT